jgi:hypothetical protein
MEMLDSARDSVLAIFLSNLLLLMRINLTSHIHMKSSFVSSNLLSGQISYMAQESFWRKDPMARES